MAETDPSAPTKLPLCKYTSLKYLHSTKMHKPIFYKVSTIYTQYKKKREVLIFIFSSKYNIFSKST